MFIHLSVVNVLHKIYSVSPKNEPYKHFAITTAKTADPISIKFYTHTQDVRHLLQRLLHSYSFIEIHLTEI